VGNTHGNGCVSDQGFGFIDEHDGDFVPDLVKQLALIANQPVLILGEPDLPLAFGANEDIEQFSVDRHGNLLYILGQRPSRNSNIPFLDEHDES
jgi:hypothetical protein